MKKFSKTIKKLMKNQLFIISLFFLSLLTISLISSIFIVYPILKSHSNIEVLKTNWVDRDLNDDIVDYVRISITNKGVSSFKISNVSVFIKYENEEDYIKIENSKYIGLKTEFPITLDVSVISNFTLKFHPEDYMKLGSFTFIIGIYYGEKATLQLLSKTAWTGSISPAEIIPINPTNNSWISGNIVPEVKVIGGYLPSDVKGTLFYPNGSKITSFSDFKETIIETTSYADGQGYKLKLNVTDYIGYFTEIQITFGIDNEGISSYLYINGSNSKIFQLYEGESINITFSISYTLANLKSINISLIGERNGFYDLGECSENLTYIFISGNETRNWGEDTFNLTLSVLDFANNLNFTSRTILVKDRTIPTLNVLSPTNGTVIKYKQTIDFVLKAKDSSGIDTYQILLIFNNINFSIMTVFTSSDLLQSTYNNQTNLWSFKIINKLLPSVFYDVMIVIYDNSTIHNANFTKLTLFISADSIIRKSGVTVGLLSNNSLVFNLENLLFVDLNLTRIRFRWKNVSIENISSLSIITNNHSLLKPSTYTNNTEYLIDTGNGQTIFSNSSLILKLDFNFSKPETTIFNIGAFEIDFYIENLHWQTLSFNIINGNDIT